VVREIKESVEPTKPHGRTLGDRTGGVRDQEKQRRADSLMLRARLRAPIGHSAM